MSEKKQSSGVTIGNVSGGVYGSVIAGRDVRNANITIGGQPTSADKEPTLVEFNQLMREIQKELQEITQLKDALKAVSSAAPFTAKGAEQSVKDAAVELVAKPKVKPEDAKSAQEKLAEATGILSTILDGAKAIAQEASETGTAVKPLIEKLTPLIEKVSVAAFWVAKLWGQ